MVNLTFMVDKVNIFDMLMSCVLEDSVIWYWETCQGFCSGRKSCLKHKMKCSTSGTDS